MEESLGVGLLRAVFVLFEAEPVEGLLGHAPHEVFADAIAAVGAAFVAQVNRGGTGGDFDNQLRRAGEVAVIGHMGGAAVFRQPTQQGVRLHGVFGVEDDGGVGESSDVWMPTATEAIYGMARVDIGGLRDVNEDGAVGAWGARAVSTIGTISRAIVGPYDGRRARRWGAKGVPRNLAAKAAAHKVRTCSLVTSYDQMTDALANGYPVVVCSPPGFTDTRDMDGFCQPRGLWNHAMLIVGVRSDARPGACLYQSWGPTVPSGPLALDQPGNSFWVDRLEVEGMIDAGDTWSISQFEGYPGQELPDRWSYDGFA